MKNILATGKAVTLREMIDNIEEMAQVAGLRGDGSWPNTAADTTYITINSDSIKLALVEETLTDGSKVYNIELTEACA